MKQKKTYIQPSMRMVVIKATPHLLAGSPSPKNKFIDDPDYEWDEGGAN